MGSMKEKMPYFNRNWKIEAPKSRDECQSFATIWLKGWIQTGLEVKDKCNCNELRNFNYYEPRDKDNSFEIRLDQACQETESAFQLWLNDPESSFIESADNKVPGAG